MKRITHIFCLALVLLLALTAPALAFEELSKGSKGDAVVELQKKLNELGYSVGTADGDFGGKTVAALQQFQTDKGLEATGILDEVTYNALFGDAEVIDIFPCNVGDLIILTSDGIATKVSENEGALYYERLYNDYLNHTGTAQHISNKRERGPMTDAQWTALLDAFKGLESVDTNGDGQLSMDEIFK